VNDAVVDAARAHEPPKVTVTTWPTTTTVGEQVPVKPAPIVATMPYVDGRVTVAGKVAEMVDEEFKEPVAEDLNPTVHVTPAPACVDESAKVTVVLAVEAVIAAMVVGLPAVESCDVATEKVLAV
jgi:hypothetical protein